MDLSDITVPYEILIRFDEAGDPKGAHIQWRRIVTLDGEVLKDDAQPAEPLSLDGLDASDLMSDVTAAALRRVTDLEAENAALGMTVEDLGRQIQELALKVPVPAPEPEVEPVPEGPIDA